MFANLCLIRKLNETKSLKLVKPAVETGKTLNQFSKLMQRITHYKIKTKSGCKAEISCACSKKWSINMDNLQNHREKGPFKWTACRRWTDGSSGIHVIGVVEFLDIGAALKHLELVCLGRVLIHKQKQKKSSQSLPPNMVKTL